MSVDEKKTALLELDGQACTVARRLDVPGRRVLVAWEAVDRAGLLRIQAESAQGIDVGFRATVLAVPVDR